MNVAHAYRRNGLGARDENGNVPCAQCGLPPGSHRLPPLPDSCYPPGAVPLLPATGRTPGMASASDSTTQLDVTWELMDELQRQRQMLTALCVQAGIDPDEAGRLPSDPPGNVRRIHGTRHLELSP